MLISGKIHFFVIFLFLIDDGFWVWHSRVSDPEFNFISFHGIDRTMSCVCIWSQYWLRDVQTTTVACRASFLISCLHDQPRSTTINHDQHGRSGGVTLYDQQESHPACGVDLARGKMRIEEFCENLFALQSVIGCKGAQLVRYLKKKVQRICQTWVKMFFFCEE